MKPHRILLLEDEVLIADSIERCLSDKGYRVVGKALSYAEATQLFQCGRPDLVLIDIRLSGPRSGIDFAHYLRDQPRRVPFVYLTSQLDRRYIESAKETYPAGFLTKPLQRESLYTTIEVALHNHYRRNTKSIVLRAQEGSFRIAADEILYFEADHVYIKVYLVGGAELRQRGGLQELLDQLPPDSFVQTHRSYGVNTRRVDRWDKRHVYLNGQSIPLSRSRRESVLSKLQVGL